MIDAHYSLMVDCETYSCQIVCVGVCGMIVNKGSSLSMSVSVGGALGSVNTKFILGGSAPTKILP